jgi:hypothetical protein
MIDPLTAFAAVKGAISAGKELHSMTKELSSFFDSVDGAKKKHQKKKDSVFTSSNEEALDTWVKKQQSIQLEADLRELIMRTKGYSAYQDLLKIRRDIAKERKEQERKARLEKQRLREQIETVVLVSLLFILLVAGSLAALYYKGSL